MQDDLDHLRDTAIRHAAGPLTATPIPRLGISVAQAPSGLQAGLYEPMLCLVLQGAKEVTIGDRQLRYDRAGYFVASVELPASGCVVEASPERPYVGVSLRLDREGLAALLPEAPVRPEEAPGAAFAVSPVTPQLLDPWRRLVALLDTPQDIPVLAPMVEREILYRLLQGPQGGVLRQIAQGGGRLSQVRRAMAWIRSHFDQPLRIEELAGLAGMSPASFHRHFKAATAMSPLQYQKQLRLQQARTLLAAHRDAAGAAYAVGYESASQFSREYARMFGASPARDALRLRREGAEVSTAA
jgi:AraC-like DNA-binding protein